MNIEATIRKNIELWAQQYNDHDAASLAGWYTNDSVYITPTGLGLVGPEQIHAYFDASFKRAPKARIAVEIGPVQLMKPDLAIANGTFEITNAVDPTGKPVPIKGPWVSTFVMQQERWIPIAHASAITLQAYVPAHT